MKKGRVKMLSHDQLRTLALNLISDGTETDQIEQKRRPDISTDDGKAVILKSIAAIANSNLSEESGYLILGSDKGIAH